MKIRYEKKFTLGGGGVLVYQEIKYTCLYGLCCISWELTFLFLSKFRVDSTKLITFIYTDFNKRLVCYSVSYYLTKMAPIFPLPCIAFKYKMVSLDIYGAHLSGCYILTTLDIKCLRYIGTADSWIYPILSNHVLETSHNTSSLN